MRAFFVRWRSARKFREFELFADENIGACLVNALEMSGGMAVWQAGTLWKCPGCGDRTLRTEEFLEGLRQAEAYLRDAEAYQKNSALSDEEPPPDPLLRKEGETSGSPLLGKEDASGFLACTMGGGERSGASRSAALDWLENVAAQMLGCERDRVYIKDEGTVCRYSTETYISRI